MQLEWGDGHLLKVEGIGTRILHTAVGEVTNTITISDVFYVPGFINIVSYLRMREKGILLEDNGDKRAKLRCDKDTVAYVDMPAKGEKALPSLALRTSRTYITYANPAAASQTNWHRRYGHINNRYVTETPKVVKGMHITDKD